MEVDWEVEVGGEAPVIDALWPGFIDLRSSPDRLAEIAEAAAVPALARLLHSLNAVGSPLWTAKCDVWEPGLTEANEALPTGGHDLVALSCYIDLLPRTGQVFADWRQAEAFCRTCVAHLAPLPLPTCRTELVVRLAIAGPAEGFGVTAYFRGAGRDQKAAAQALAEVLAAFADSFTPTEPPATGASKLQ